MAIVMPSISKPVRAAVDKSTVGSNAALMRNVIKAVTTEHVWGQTSTWGSRQVEEAGKSKRQVHYQNQ
jgi:hypothetical protein